MTLRDQLTEDMKTAMRARDMGRLQTIRFMLSEIKNYEIDHGEQDDAGVQKVIASLVKKFKDAQADFEKAGRTDLVEAETAKIAVMEAYLPAQLSDEELEKIVTEVKAELGSEAKMGDLMKAIMPKVQGRADGKRVSAALQK